jgi:hypothetical protein
MATATRPYKVTDTTTQTLRLVQATNQAQARNFVAKHQYEVKVASANDIIELMANGIKPELATDDEKAE